MVTSMRNARIPQTAFRTASFSSEFSERGQRMLELTSVSCNEIMLCQWCVLCQEGWLHNNDLHNEPSDLSLHFSPLTFLPTIASGTEPFAQTISCLSSSFPCKL